MGTACLSGEAINSELKSHALSVERWRFRDLVDLCHEWAARFNQEFDLALPTPALQIDAISARRFGTYRRGRNGFGLRHEITINARHLDRSVASLLETLLHEMLHLWQELYGSPGKSNYHNRQFRHKAKLYGLVIDQRGHSLGVTPGRFMALLAKYRVDMMGLRFAETAPLPQIRRGDSKLKKWRCGCTNVRCAVELVAECLKCGMRFEEAPPAW